jgi:hypothetical protein
MFSSASATGKDCRENVVILNGKKISDGAIDVFCGFLRQMPGPLKSLYLQNLPLQQIRCLLEALHTNISVKELWIGVLHGKEGASWMADLLRHKIDFMYVRLYRCCFPFPQILPLLRGQPNLKSLGFNESCISNDICLFTDPESTQLLIDNILLPSSTTTTTTINVLGLTHCGLTVKNRPLMAALHKNTTIAAFEAADDEEIKSFLVPIALRNKHLAHINAMLGTTTITVGSGTANATQRSSSTTIPPPTGLWPTVLAKVG